MVSFSVSIFHRSRRTCIATKSSATCALYLENGLGYYRFNLVLLVRRLVSRKTRRGASPAFLHMLREVSFPPRTIANLAPTPLQIVVHSRSATPFYNDVTREGISLLTTVSSSYTLPCYRLLPAFRFPPPFIHVL